MRLLLLTAGSHGDINPFIALARAINARGHTALLATNPYFEKQITQAGIDFAPLGDHADLGAVIREHDIMHPRRGPLRVMRRMVLPNVPMVHQRTTELAREFRADAVIAHPICIGAGWAAEQLGIPGITAVLSPSVWFNPSDQLVLTPFRGHTPTPRAVRFDLAVGRFFLRLMLDRPLNALRRELGLPPQRDVFITTALSGDLNLGLWSPHFRGPVTGDPDRGVICGFPWHDRLAEQESPPAVLTQFLDSGEPPIVFTLGTTGVHAPGRYFADALAAAGQLGRRAVLLIGRDGTPPAGLPRTVLALKYAPYSALLPRALVTVHHGGIGSTAQALRAGRPMLVTPLSHDQPDNAARIKRLGVGDILPHRRITGPRLAAALAPLIEDREVAQRAATLGAQIAAEDGAARAVTEIERRIGQGSAGVSARSAPATSAPTTSEQDAAASRR